MGALVHTLSTVLSVLWFEFLPATEHDEVLICIIQILWLEIVIVDIAVIKFKWYNALIRFFRCIHDRDWSLQLIGRWLQQDDIDISDTYTCRNFKGPKMDVNLNS